MTTPGIEQAHEWRKISDAIRYTSHTQIAAHLALSDSVGAATTAEAAEHAVAALRGLARAAHRLDHTSPTAKPR